MPRKPDQPKPLFEQLDLGLEFPEETEPLFPGEYVRVTHHYVGWDRPILDSAVDFLSAGWDGSEALDLTGRMVITPTKHSGRRLRESLAVKAARFEQVVIPPLVVTPLYLTDPSRLEDLELPITDGGLARAIWISAMLGLDLDRFRHVFPVDPVERNLTWAIKTAGDLLQVRDLLSREGLTFGMAAKKLAPREIETQRWREIARLEKQIVEETGQHGYADFAECSLEAARRVMIPPEIESVTLIACADLANLTVEALEQVARKLPVDLVIAAPEDRREWFDTWGNPLPDFWLEAEIDLPDAKDRIQSAANPSEQAEMVSELLSAHENPAETVAIGVPDPDTIAPMEQALSAKDWPGYDPSGKPLRQHSIYYLIEQTHRLVETASFDAFQNLLRIPDWLEAMMRAVEEVSGVLPERSDFLGRMDQLAQEALPDELGDAADACERGFRDAPELKAGVDWARNWVRRFRHDDFAGSLVDYLVGIFENREFGEENQNRFPEVSSHLLPAIEVIVKSEAMFRQPLDAAGKFELLLELIGDRRLYLDRSSRSIDLEGWAELLWEDAPHLIVTGMNDSFVPESVVSHSYLPDSARRFLEITDNRKRFARDAYLLTVFVESRRHTGGRVDFIFGRQGVTGDPLRPSRLLFQCPDEELAARTLQFFSGGAKHHAPLPWKLAWKLQPRRLPESSKVFRRIYVTAFKSYLTCPFRFYLKYGLQMEDVEAGKTEMNAMEFGNLVHDTLEAFGRDETAARLTDPDAIREFFYERIDTILNFRYGRTWTTPVVIQREAARRRLGYWAEIEAEQRREGWRILEPESQIGSEGDPFVVAGMKVTGRIDRIERHDQFGIRVFDFKTFSPKEKDVIQFHIQAIKRSEDPEDFPEWCRVENALGKASHWVDLQLPLYRLSLEGAYPGEKVSVGYVTLGQTRKEIGINMWEDLDENYLESARRCAEGVVESILAHRFWPPAERMPYRNDIFEELFFGDAREAVDPSAMLG